jgi:hypothetical protein
MPKSPGTFHHPACEEKNGKTPLPPPAGNRGEADLPLFDLAGCLEKEGMEADDLLWNEDGVSS